MTHHLAVHILNAVYHQHWHPTDRESFRLIGLYGPQWTIAQSANLRLQDLFEDKDL